MPSFRRLEVATDVACNGGVVLATIPDSLSIAPVYDLTGDEQCIVTLPRTSPAYAQLQEKRVLRLTRRSRTGVESVEEWRIADREDNSGRGDPPAVVTARSLLLDLGEVIISGTRSDGTADYTIGFVDLTLSEAIDAVILPALAARGKGWFARGTIDSTKRFSYDDTTGQTVLSVLRTWTELFGLELRIRKNGTTSYFIDLLTEIGSGAPTPYLETRKNLDATKRTRSTAEQATRVIPRGVDTGADRASLAEVRWKVTAVNAGTKRLTIADELGLVTPIQFDDQLNGWYVFRDKTGRTFPIVDTLKATQEVELADVSTFAVNELVFLRIADPGTNALNWRGPMPAGYSFTGALPLYYVSAVNGGTLRTTLKDTVGTGGGQTTNIYANDDMVDWTAVFCSLVMQSVGGITGTIGSANTYQCGAGVNLSSLAVGDIIIADQSSSTAPPFLGVSSFPFFPIGTVTAFDNTAKTVTVSNRYFPSKPVFTVSYLQPFTLRAYRPAVSHMVRRSYTATDEIETLAVTSIAVGQLVEVRQSCGGVLPSYLDAPASVASYGAIERFIDRGAMRGETELVPNAFMRVWTGASTTPPDGWSLQAGFGGTPEVLKETGAGFWNYGGQSARVTLVRYPGSPIVTGGARFVSPPFRVWRNGNYRTAITFKLKIQFAKLSVDASLIVKLESTSPNVTVGPLGTNGLPKPLRTLYAMTHADASIPDTDRFDINTWYEITVTAFDVSDATASSPLQVVFQDGNTGGEIEMIVDAVQVTQTDYDPGVFIEASEAVILWEEANRYLSDFGDPATEYAIQFRDLARIDGSDWDVVDAIVLGGRISLRDAQLGITTTPRVVRYAPNELDPLASTLVLSSRMKWLTRILATLVDGSGPTAPAGSISTAKLSSGGSPPGSVPVVPPGGGPPVWGPQIPSGPAGGALSGTYPNPDLAVALNTLLRSATVQFPFDATTIAGDWLHIIPNFPWKLTGWRIRALDLAKAETNVSATFGVQKLPWAGGAIVNLIGAGTVPALSAAAKATGDTSTWGTISGVAGDSIIVSVSSVTIGTATSLLFALTLEKV